MNWLKQRNLKVLALKIEELREYELHHRIRARAERALARELREEIDALIAKQREMRS